MIKCRWFKKCIYPYSQILALSFIYNHELHEGTDHETKGTQMPCRIRKKLHGYQEPVSISDKTAYRKISQNLEAARFVFRIVRSLLNLEGTSAALLPRCLSNLKAIRTFDTRSRPFETLRDLTIRRLIGYWNGAQGPILLQPFGAVTNIFITMGLFQRKPQSLIEMLVTPPCHPNWPLTRYGKLWVAHGPGMSGTFSPPPTLKETAS